MLFNSVSDLETNREKKKFYFGAKNVPRQSKSQIKKGPTTFAVCICFLDSVTVLVY